MEAVATSTNYTLTRIRASGCSTRDQPNVREAVKPRQWLMTMAIADMEGRKFGEKAEVLIGQTVERVGVTIIAPLVERQMSTPVNRRLGD
jgi:hypothetical protein